MYAFSFDLPRLPNGTDGLTSAGPAHKVLLADLSPGSTPSEFFAQLEAQDIGLFAHDLLIIRLPVFDSSYPFSEKEWAESLPPNIPVRILYSSEYQHFITPPLDEDRNDPTKDYDDQAVLAETQKAEMDYLVREGRAAFPPLEGHCYETPSGKRVKSFLRAGNIQTSRAALDGLFFWLLPKMKDKNAILTDTWSIGSTALNASRRLADYEFLENPPAVEILAGFFDDPNARLQDFEDCIRSLKAEILNRGLKSKSAGEKPASPYSTERGEHRFRLRFTSKTCPG